MTKWVKRQTLLKNLIDPDWAFQATTPNKDKSERMEKLDAKMKNNSIEKESKRSKKKKGPPRNYLGKNCC